MFKHACAISILTLGLTACSGIHAPTQADYTGLTTTLNQTKSNKTTKELAICVQTKLTEQYPSASLVMEADSLYSGKIPGTEANKPQAVYEVSAAPGELIGSVTLKQVNPNDTTLIELFKSCL